MRNPGGGTILLLCAALRERIREAVKDLRFDPDIKGQEPRAPEVVNGYLPPKRSSTAAEFPFVIVRPWDGRIEENGFIRQQVKLIVGTYSEAFDGHEDALIVFQRVMQAVQERPTLDNRYTLQYPLTWEVYDEQKYPFWHMVATTEWIVPTPVQLPDEGVL